MIITEKITVSNTKDVFTEEELLQLVFLFITKHDHIKGGTKASALEACAGILITRRIQKFLEWRPWIKTINLFELNEKIYRSFGVKTGDIYYYRYAPNRVLRKYNNSVDLQIKALFELYNHGIMINKWKDLNSSLKIFIVLYLELDRFIERLCDQQIKENQQKIFSTDVREKRDEYDFRHKQDERYRYRVINRETLEAHELAGQELRTYITSASGNATNMHYANIDTTADTNDSMTMPIYASGDNESYIYASTIYNARRISNGDAEDSASGTTADQPSSGI